MKSPTIWKDYLKLSEIASSSKLARASKAPSPPGGIGLIKYLPPKFNVMFKFNYSKYNPRGLIFSGASVSKVGS